MTPSRPLQTDDPTLAVVVSRLDDLRADVASLRTEVQTAQAGYVIRAEFEAWRTGIGREIGDIKSSVARIEADAATAVAAAENRATAAVAAAENRATVAESRRPSGLAIAMGVIAFSTLALSVVVLLIQK